MTTEPSTSNAEAKGPSPLLIWAAAAIVAVLLVGVPLVFLRGGGDEPDQAATTVVTSTTVTTETPGTTGPGEESTTTAAVEQTVASVTATTVPGEAFDIGPAAGAVVAVVGVAHDDVLNVRELPGTQYDIVATLAPLADDVVATGRHRLLAESIWDEVTVDGVTGWVNSRYLGYVGGVDDLTSFVVSQMGGVAAAETMLDLGTLVAESFDCGEGGFGYEMTVPPTVGDLGEVTFDVVGLPDDAQLGWRLHIFGTPDAGGEGFTLGSVEATALCGRGVTEDGFCI